MQSTQRSRVMTYTTVRQLCRPDTIRAGLLFVSWIGAVVVLLLLAGGVLSPDISLATKRQIVSFGLLVVEIAAVYQIITYRRRRDGIHHRT